MVADSAAWRLVQPALSKRTKVCSYDRAGLGFSDAAGPPRDAAAIVRDLHALLRGAEVAPPYVLVGWSSGGLYTDNIVGFLSFVALIYFVTQVYFFAGRIAQEVPFDGIADIDVGLRDVANYALGSNELATRLYEPYTTQLTDPHYKASIPINL